MSSSSADVDAANSSAPSPGRTTGPDPSPDRFSRWRRWTHPILIANLVAQIVIIFTGGAVRLTSSGLGCDTWPMCQPGHFTPARHAAASYHQYIEFGNRTLTGVLTVIAVVVVLLAATDRRRSSSYRMLAWAPLVGVVLQAVVGGVVVLLDLNPAFVAVHYLISAGLVWASTLLLYRNGEGDTAPHPTIDRTTERLGWVVAALLVPVLCFGVMVTGSGPHGGDDNVAYRFAVDPVLITQIHSGFVWLFVIALIALGVVAFKRNAPDRVRNGFVMLLGVTLAQGAIGYTQYLTGLPIGLVALHMLGSALLISATTWLVLTLRTRERVAERVEIPGEAAQAA